eukprot:CAMPEP_0206163832 /NCGR_PEP_ID=MMETSP1474-20131121/11650_1 /ASSEMBLY_ACC=CAM_ASM_001110 /TAXON_ID=97495 /ORGANISM="Imantonia sp., Strain RCC918" /LENGTH=166 /DNA_ID=CAMNT_0053566419 /DNA_START=371 /DNA_END=871 /DNA_ORIENTATION=-
MATQVGRRSLLQQRPSTFHLFLGNGGRAAALRLVERLRVRRGLAAAELRRALEAVHGADEAGHEVLGEGEGRCTPAAQAGAAVRAKHLGRLARAGAARASDAAALAVLLIRAAAALGLLARGAAVLADAAEALAGPLAADGDVVEVAGGVAADASVDHAWSHVCAF